MKCFVTGGAGFIGSNMVDRLISEGHKVTVYDNFSSGAEKFISSHAQNPDFRAVRADLLDAGTLSRAMKGHDVVFHFAANPDIISGLSNTDLDFKNGTVATFNVLESMRKNQVSSIAFSSSGTVYGYTDKQKVGEDYGPVLPVSLYGANKVAAEALVSGFSNIFGFKAYIFRFANIVGKRQNHGVVYDFIMKLKKNPKELLILGDGRQTKHYVLVDELVDAMLFAMEKSKEKLSYYNISNDSAIDVNKIAGMVTGEMGLKNVRFRYTGGSQGWKGDVPISLLSPEKINRLGWRAKHDSAGAVRITIKTLLKEMGYKQPK